MSNNQDEDIFSWLQTAAATFDDNPSHISSPESHDSYHDIRSDFDSGDGSSDSDSYSDSDHERPTIYRQFQMLSPLLRRFQHPRPSSSNPPRDRPGVKWDSTSTPNSSLGNTVLQRRRKRHLYSPSRNVQTFADTSQSVDKSNPWECPHCPWIQRNKRTPDLKRHISTHTRLLHPAQWVCRGALEEDAACSPQAEACTYSGIAGCGKTFSRRDALKRHLDNLNINCARATRDRD
jgi:hypothetical protein